LQADDNPENPKFILLTIDKILPRLTELINKIKSDKKAILIFDSGENYKVTKLRHLFFQLIDKKCETPVIIKRKYKNLTEEELMNQYAAIGRNLEIAFNALHTDMSRKANLSSKRGFMKREK